MASWTKDQLASLKRFYGIIPLEDLADALDHSPCAVKSKAGVLHLGKRRRWNANEIAFVRNNYQTMMATEIAEQLGRSLSSTYQVAKKLGLRKLESLKPYYPEIRRLHAARQPDRVIAKQLGLSHDCVKHTRRYQLGLPTIPDIEGKQQAVRTQHARLGIKNSAELRVLAFRNYAVRNGWPADLRPRAVQILNQLSANGPMTKVQLAKAIGMRWEGLPSRKVLVSNDPEGSYLAHLIRRGLVIQLGRAYKRGYHWEMVYSLSLTAQRSLPDERTA